MIGLRRHLALLWCLAPILLLLTTWRPEGGDRGRAARLPSELAGFSVAHEYPLSSSVLEMLGTPDAVWRRYDRGAEQVFVIGVFHDENWKSVHPPETCLRGSNMEVVREGVIPAADGGAATEYGFLQMRALDRDQDYVSLYLFLAGAEFATPGYWSFFAHHAPRALLRQSVSGCLLRVETWVGSDGLDAATGRCREALDALVQAARGELR
jgi:hypothetical protein